PVHNEEKKIRLIFAEIRDVFKELSYDYEVNFVNDGSTDNSLLEIMKLSREDGRVRGLDFSRNFGKEPATSAGCHFAKGDAVVTIDADLQHPPALIPKFLELWEGGAEVVYTVRIENKNVRWTKEVSSKLFYWLFNKVSEVPTESGTTDFRLMDKKVIAVFRGFPERERMFRGMIDWMGYRRERVEFVARDRINGKATYSYRKLFDLALNSLTSFSLLPLRLAGYFGVVITLSSGILLTAMLISRWFFDPLLFSPIAILAVGNIFLIGIVLVSLGLIALYIARIHSEVINRPLYIVREGVNMEEKKEEKSP
ncbi:MAG: glycosyltransferase, partial [Candidatus Moranbacteria bacterium]|nr:glycosyltransferase [Candidatus Moranbacteria bacterium]